MTQPPDPGPVATALVALAQKSEQLPTRLRLTAAALINRNADAADVERLTVTLDALAAAQAELARQLRLQTRERTTP